MLEHSKESNEERTSGSDGAVNPTSSFATPDIEPIAKVVADNDKAIEAAPNELSSVLSSTESDRPAPNEIPYVFYFWLFFPLEFAVCFVLLLSGA